MSIRQNIAVADLFTGSGDKLRFPGENLSPDNLAYNLTARPDTFYTPARAGLPAHKVTLDERKEWLLFNYLLRPPLTDLEIICMPAMEIVKLYYTLNVTQSCNLSKPNAVVSRGLPIRYGINHDSYFMQARIYDLRTDLHFVTDAAGQQFPVLLPVAQMRPPRCDDTAYAIQALSAFAAILTFGAAWYVTLILNVAETTASAVNQVETAAQIAKVTGRLRDVLSGIQVAKQVLADPVPTPAILQSLSVLRTNWQSICDTALLHKDEILNLWRYVPQPEVYCAVFYDPGFDGSLGKAILAGNPAILAQLQKESGGGVGATNAKIHGITPAMFYVLKSHALQYVSDWQPWQRFFYSDTVEKMVNDFESQGLPVPQTQVIGN